MAAYMVRVRSGTLIAVRYCSTVPYFIPVPLFSAYPSLVCPFPPAPSVRFLFSAAVRIDRLTALSGFYGSKMKVRLYLHRITPAAIP